VIDLHFVVPGLAVGACFPMEAAPRLAAEHGISRVVDVRVEERDDEEVLRRCGITLLHLPTEDTQAIAQEQLRRGVAFVEEGLSRGEAVLVHCRYGIGRSALLALCALVSRGHPPLEALERAKAARRVVSPSPAQLRAFLEFCAAVHEERAVPWNVPGFREVCAIAWSHLGRGGETSLEAAVASSTRQS
jgi:protein-tyrosine phosphatase